MLFFNKKILTKKYVIFYRNLKNIWMDESHLDYELTCKMV